MLDRTRVNVWAMDMPVEGFQSLGDVKFKKLIDFMSSLKVVDRLDENSIIVDEYIFDRCEVIKEEEIDNLNEVLLFDRQAASKLYTIYKKFIDLQDTFPIDGYVLEQLTPCPYRPPIKQKAKIKKKKIKLPENVIDFSAYRKKSK